MATRVDRPFLDRTASVYALDHHWSPDARWNVRTTLVASDVDQHGRQVRDSGAQMRIDHQITPAWREQLYLLHSGGDLQLNDFGFLDRNNFNYGRYEIGRRITGLEASSPFSSHYWKYAVSHRENDNGVKISDALAISLDSERRDGGSQTFELAGWGPGYDDLISRGHGLVRHRGRLVAVAERFFPKRQHWSFLVHGEYNADGLGGVGRGSALASLEANDAITDELSVFAELSLARNPDLWFWNRDVDRLVSYRTSQVQLTAGLTWLPDPKQELRVRLEALGLDAKALQSWNIGSDGRPVRSNVVANDFALRNLAFQVRYRYEFAPLSYLYVAYVRGGSLFEEGPGPYSASDAFGRAFDLRDSEQLLVKLSYRFEL